MSPVPAIVIPFFIPPAYVDVQEKLAQTTATTLRWDYKQQPPTEAFSLTGPSPDWGRAVDMMSFAQSIYPDAKPLSPEEKKSVNDFFWSQLE